MSVTMTTMVIELDIGAKKVGVEMDARMDWKAVDSEATDSSEFVG